MEACLTPYNPAARCKCSAEAVEIEVDAFGRDGETPALSPGSDKACKAFEELVFVALQGAAS